MLKHTLYSKSLTAANSKIYSVLFSYYLFFNFIRIVWKRHTRNQKLITIKPLLSYPVGGYKNTNSLPERVVRSNQDQLGDVGLGRPPKVFLWIVKPRYSLALMRPNSRIGIMVEDCHYWIDWVWYYFLRLKSLKKQKCEEDFTFVTFKFFYDKV